ncbi:DUF3147 family protein [Novosphingobium sp. KCTC 2891]|uniref:DUF3147 family protein n=1 Tax=Novosphingobium sp. KCTC 2891 TaxID=2989730 RepID=UPI00222153AA|nr:DUF3147 family protein [Novosphingobium sp. KCTC 2891]MCW1384824.1 DUF3147 family protein [Novosphingobium sp. KCTC 2891]
MWGQLAIKALVSGILIAAASEIARRSPGWGALVGSLPLTTLLALTWLWRDTHDTARAADYVLGTACYVAAALPAFGLMALMFRRGLGLAPTLIAGSLAAIVLTTAMVALGRRAGLPV